MIYEHFPWELRSFFVRSCCTSRLGNFPKRSFDSVWLKEYAELISDECLEYFHSKAPWHDLWWSQSQTTIQRCFERGWGELLLDLLHRLCLDSHKHKWNMEDCAGQACIKDQYVSHFICKMTQITVWSSLIFNCFHAKTSQYKLVLLTLTEDIIFHSNTRITRLSASNFDRHTSKVWSKAYLHFIHTEHTSELQ